ARAFHTGRQEVIMWRTVLAVTLGLAVAGAFVTHGVFAQNPPATPSPPHDHGSMPPQGGDMHAQHMPMMRGMAAAGPTLPGQDAFGAIAEIVRALDADPATDWTRVDLERLRQHLIDMSEVILRSSVKPASVPGGLAMDVTGGGRTEQAIAAMVVPHAAE